MSDWLERLKALGDQPIIPADDGTVEPVEPPPIVIRIGMPQPPEPIRFHWLWAVPIGMVIGMMLL